MYTTMEKENKLYLKQVNQIKNSEEYIQNKMQIDCIKNVLVNHADVPEKLVTWLIEAVERNTTLISEAKLKHTNIK